jgi:hypothetical protein
MAREFLAIPASGVGVERLFNQARDICTYRRHSLKPETIRLLVMLMCMDSFNLKEEYRLSRAANDLEEEWEQCSEDDDDNNDDENQSVYAISEKDEVFDLYEDEMDYPQDTSVFNLLEDNLFGLQNNDIFELPDDLEAVLQDNPIIQETITQQNTSVAITDITTLTTPSAQRQRQPTPHLAIPVPPVTHQLLTNLQVTPRRSTRLSRQ